MKNFFLNSQIMCTSNNAVIEQTQQPEQQEHPCTEHESCIHGNPSDDMLFKQKNCIAVLSIDDPTDKIDPLKRNGDDIGKLLNEFRLVQTPPTLVPEIFSVSKDIVDELGNDSPESSKPTWNYITEHIKDALENHAEDDFQADDCTQGSDNSKCSVAFDKPISKKSSDRHGHKVKNTTDQPILDKTPSKFKDNDAEDHDNTTCTCSESENSTIPNVIYIRRDIPPIVPDDEALGQLYSVGGDGKTYRTIDPAASGTSAFMKGLRLFTGGFGKHNKVHLDDDASETFQQTLVEL
jgi:hypothetical protein